MALRRCYNDWVQASPQTRARAEILRLMHRDLGVRDFSLTVARTLRRAVSFDGVCVLTIDPATALPTGEIVEHGLPPAAMPRMAEIEVAEVDFNKFAELAGAPRPAASLSDATQGDLERSLRQRELRQPEGLGDELRAALVADSGTWGGITLLRATGPAFTSAETGFLASLSGHLAEGLQRALLLTTLSAHPDDAEAGLLVLADDNSVQLANAAGQRWLDELRGGRGDGHHLPIVVHAVASRARVVADGDVTGVATARARTATPSGRWLLVRGRCSGRARTLGPRSSSNRRHHPRGRPFHPTPRAGPPTSASAQRAELAEGNVVARELPDAGPRRGTARTHCGAWARAGQRRARRGRRSGER